MQFEEAALAGDLATTLRMGLLTGTLFAIGNSWAMAIHEICREAAKGSEYPWVAELVAALLTTGVGALIAINVRRMFKAPKLPAKILGRTSGGP